MLARVLEAHGIATTSISLVREHTAKIKPPRALFVPFPFGHAFGRPDDPALQRRVLRAALDLLAAPAGPVLEDFPDAAETGDVTPAPVQASAVAPTGGEPGDVVAEARAVFRDHEQWRAKNGGRTTFGLSGLAPGRFPDVVTFLERFAAGEDGDVPGRAADVPPVDGFYQEVRAKTNPLGLRGLGECGNPGLGAAIANAVCDAFARSGVSITALPATPARVFAGLGAARAATR